MKTIFLLTSILALFALTHSCTKTEYVDRIVEITDTVYVDKIVTETDTVYVDKIIETGRGVTTLNAAFKQYSATYPGALPLIKQYIKTTIEADNDIAGVMVYKGMYLYNYGSVAGGSPDFSVITIKEVKGVYRMVKSVFRFYIKDGNRLSIIDEYNVYENAAGLPAPQADFAKNTFAGFIGRADITAL